MNKKKVIILVSCVAVIGIIVALCFIFGGDSDEVYSASTDNYRFNNQYTILDNGKVEVVLDKGKFKDGSWSFTADDKSIVSFSVKKGNSKDTVTVTGKNPGTTNITAVLNDGTEDIYKVVFYYTKFTNDVIFDCLYECNIDDNLTFGNDEVGRVICELNTPTDMTCTFTGKDMDNAEISCDSDLLNAYFALDEDGNKYLTVNPIEADFETEIKVTTNSFIAVLMVKVDENFYITPVSGTVVANENGRTDATTEAK